MGISAFGSQKSDKIAPAIEEKLRKELGATAPIPYQVEGEGGSTTVGTVMGDVAKGLFGGKSNILFAVIFDIVAPRKTQLRVNLDRQGVGCHLGALLYSTKLSKIVKGEVILEGPKMFGSSKFTGDADAIARLNAKGDLLKRLGKFARTEAEIGGMTIRMDRFVKILPEESGAQLIINSLPRPVSMGMDAMLDAKEFMDIAAMVEAAL